MTAASGLTRAQVAQAATRALADYLLRPPGFVPQPHQIPPPGDWYGWLMNAGRGSGKTRAASNWIIEHVKGPPCLPGPTPHWIGIIAPTLGDAVTACVNGPSGIKTHDPTATLSGGAGGLFVKWNNGSRAKLFGAHSPEDVERLRAGGNTCAVWCEELAAWRYLQECYEQMRFGLRTGPRPRWIASTTPKPKPLIKKLVKDTPHNVVVTHATTNDNPHLEQEIRDALFEEYADRDIGRQELYAAIMEQDEAALWRRTDLEEFRVVEAPPLAKISVGVDPSGGAGEQGIVVVGKHVLDVMTTKGRQRKFEGYVLDDRTCHLGPAGWGRKAVQAAIDWEADDIVVETNYGGQMAVVTIRDAAEALGVSIPVKEVVASRGKRVRAEPVAALSSRGQWHHVGLFEQLEDQLCTWTEDLGYSPDRLDAMVWSPWHQRIVSTRPRGVASFPAGGSMTRSIG
jgi:phage terminase large subunit-like protein